MRQDNRAPIRVVFDTNILMSAFLSGTGTIWKALEFVHKNGYILASAETLDELVRKMTTSSFAAKYWTEHERSLFIDRMSQLMEIVEVTTEICESQDPKDDMFLALALDGKADYIISGDKKHLLVLDPFRGIPILSPAEFLERIAAPDQH